MEIVKLTMEDFQKMGSKLIEKEKEEKANKEDKKHFKKMKKINPKKKKYKNLSIF